MNIEHLKQTMYVEKCWKVLKHDDYAVVYNNHNFIIVDIM